MTDVYRVGVNIAMASNGAQLLGAISRNLLGVHANVKQLEGGFNNLKLAIGGALAIGAGVALVGMFKAPLDEARKLEMAVGRFSRFGLGPERTREATNFAKSMNIAGSTYVENMNRMAEAQGVFRESGLSGDAALRGAKLAAPVLAKIDFANSGLDEDSKAKMKTQSLAMLRFIEMRGGVNSPEQFNAIADAGFKAITSSGGSMNWEQLRQFMARGGVAAQGLSNEALFAKMEPVITELKGSTAGFALRTAYNRLNGINSLGMGPVAHELIDAGIWDRSKVSFAPNGGLRRFNKGTPFLGAELFASDPVAFYEQKIMPMYAKRGLTPTQIGRENALIFGGTGGTMFNLIQRQLPAINRSVGAQRAALGIDAAYRAAGGTLNGRIIDMHAKFTNLMERLGEAVLPLAVKGLQILVPAIANLTKWVGEHPGQVAFFAKAALVIGGALIGLGAAALAIAAGVAIFSGGTVGLVVAGVATVVGALGALIAVNWGKLSGAATAIGHFVAEVWRVGMFILEHPFKAAGQAASGNPIGPGTAPSGGHWAYPMNWQLGTAVKTWVPDTPSRAPTAPARRAGDGGVGTVFMDGRKVGAIVSGHQAAAMGPGMTATGRVDPAVTRPAAGAGAPR